jgi:FkbM family methyltransferase
LLNWAALGRGVPWRINGVEYRIDARHRRRLGQDYDGAAAVYLREHVRPGAVCFDVGANVGVYVLQFAHWSAPNGRVVAFEPNPAASAALHRHIRLNHLGPRVRVVQAAVGAAPGKATLFAAGADGMSRLGESNPVLADQAVGVNVSLITLDQFCQEEDLWPDWLLIDVEGFEFQVLQGARQLLRRRPATGVVVEIHPSLWSSAQTTRSLAESLLEEWGLTPVPLAGQIDPLGQYGLVLLEPRRLAGGGVRTPPGERAASG